VNTKKQEFWVPVGSEQPLVEIRGLDAEAFQEMRTAMDAARPDLRAEIDRKIAQALHIIGGFDPIPLLVHIALKHGVSAPGQEEAPVGPAPTTRIEYALSLVLSMADNEKREKPTVEIESEFENLVIEILDLTSMYFATEGTAGGKYSVDEAELRALSLMHTLNMRGNAHQAHALDVLRAVASPHDRFLKEKFGFTGEDFVGTILEIERQIVMALTTWGDMMRLQAALTAKFEEWSKGAGQSVNENDRTEAFLNEPGIRAQLEQGQQLADALPSSPFEIIPNDRAMLPVLRVVSSVFGDNEPFVSAPESGGWPTNDSVVGDRPLLRRNDRWFGFGAAALLDNALQILESAIRTGDARYWETSYTKKRGVVIEDLACKYLGELLPGAEVYRNVYFELPDGKRFETDAVMLFGRTLIVVETKAGGLARSSRRGGMNAIKKDVSMLVKAAHDQARRVAEIIVHGPAVCRQGDGTVAATVPSRQELREVFFVNVTLANLAHLATRLSTAKRLDLLSSDDWPWSVCITDLRVISEILEGPSEFLAYLKARRLANDAGAAVTPDENDFLMGFLRDGLSELSEASERGAAAFLMNETAALDRYYFMREGYIDDAAKPAMDVPPEVSTLVRGLERLGADGAELAAEILGMPRSALRFVGGRLAEMIASARSTGEWHDVTLHPHATVPFGTTIAVGRIADADRWAPRIRTYVTVKKYQQKASRWMAIGIGLDDDGTLDYQAVVLEGEWRFDERLAKAERELLGSAGGGD
jgi:hypothetical protein